MKIPVSQIPGCSASSNLDILKKDFFLTAGEADAQSRMSIALLAQRAIETATDHSNILGIGYEDMKRLSLRWVVLKMAIEITRFPEINEKYSIKTWIEGVNRFFSNRAMELLDERGRQIARIHTVWAAIDEQTRGISTLGHIPKDRFPIYRQMFQIESLPEAAVKMNDDVVERNIVFPTSSIDFNRHVNAISYIKAAIDNRDVDFYDKNSITRFDVAFEHECYLGESIRVVSGSDSHVANAMTTELYRPNGQRAAAIRFVFK